LKTHPVPQEDVSDKKHTENADESIASNSQEAELSDTSLTSDRAQEYKSDRSEEESAEENLAAAPQATGLQNLIPPIRNSPALLLTETIPEEEEPVTPEHPFASGASTPPAEKKLHVSQRDMPHGETETQLLEDLDEKPFKQEEVFTVLAVECSETDAKSILSTENTPEMADGDVAIDLELEKSQNTEPMKPQAQRVEFVLIHSENRGGAFIPEPEATLLDRETEEVDVCVSARPPLDESAEPDVLLVPEDHVADVDMGETEEVDVCVSTRPTLDESAESDVLLVPEDHVADVDMGETEEVDVCVSARPPLDESAEPDVILVPEDHVADVDMEDDVRTVAGRSDVAILGDDDRSIRDFTEDFIAEQQPGKKSESNNQSSKESNSVASEIVPSPRSSTSDLTNNTDDLCNPNILDIIWSKCSKAESEGDIYYQLFGVKLRGTGKKVGMNEESSNLEPVHYKEVGIQVPDVLFFHELAAPQRRFIPSWPFHPDSPAAKIVLDELDKDHILASLRAQASAESDEKGFAKQQSLVENKSKELVNEDNTFHLEKVENRAEETLETASTSFVASHVPEYGTGSGRSTPSCSSSAESESSFPRFVHSVYPLRQPSVSSERSDDHLRKETDDWEINFPQAREETAAQTQPNENPVVKTSGRNDATDSEENNTLNNRLVTLPFISR